jgi:hypothetical protein
MRRPRKLGFDETIAGEKMPADRDIARCVQKWRAPADEDRHYCFAVMAL